MEVKFDDISPVQKQKILKDLRVVVRNEYGPPKRYNVYERSQVSATEVFTIPLVWGVDNLGIHPRPFKKYPTDIPDATVVPRPSQMECIAVCEKQIEGEYGGGIINLSTGSGKTMISIYLMAKYKYKTLVIVNTTELMDQWTKALFENIPGVRVGVIRGDKFDCEGYHVVVGMIQTISLRKEYTRIRFKFGMVFIDECHHLSSEVFSKCLFKTRCRYTFGLSATVKRQDGLEYVFKWHIGDILFSNVSNDKKQYTVFKKIDYYGKSSRELTTRGKPNIAGMISAMAEDSDRTSMVCDVLRELSDDRCVLVLSDRVSQLRDINRIIGNVDSGLMIGSVSQQDRELAKSKKIVLATYQIASEGFNLPKLNTLLFATPRSSITQSIGRIYRQRHDTDPMIIDIVDNFSVFLSQYKRRKRLYPKNDEPYTRQNECLFD
jgi:superfamily II DNA or RNA helicase